MNLADVSTTLDAAPDAVFELFATEQGLCEWMAAEAEVDLRPGGRWRWVHENGHVCSGTYIEIEAPRRLVFSYGWETGPFVEVAPGSTTVTVTFEPRPTGTFVRVVHDGLARPLIERHERGWRHFLGVLADRLGSPPTHRREGNAP